MISRLFLLLAFVAFAPARAADSDPAECRVPAGAGSLSCDQQQKCIDARFKAVNKDPNKVCEQNNKALWDKNLSSQLPKGDESNTVNAVCAGTYVRLQSALSDYKTLMYSACNQKDKAKSCVTDDNVGEGNAAMACAAKVAQDNLALSQKARAALEKAREEAAEYKRLTQEVKKKYLHDIDAIQDAEGDLRDKGMTASQIAAEKSRAGNLTGDAFGTGVALGPADVNASNGGAGNLAEYEKKQSKLIQEQDTAAATIDAFNAASKREIEGRGAVEASLRTSAGSDLLAAMKQGPASTITGGTGGGGGGGGKKTSDDDGSDTGSLLKNATSLTSLASAGVGLASALNRNNSTGSSSAIPNSIGNNATPGSTSAAPEPLAPTSFGDTPVMNGASGNPGPNGKAGQSSPPERFSAVDGSSGGGRDGAVTGSGAILPGSAGFAGGGTFIPGSGAGTGTPDASISDNGRDPASAKDPSGCSGVDCAATNDLKTQQFSSGGSLGVPKIGAPDPALATKGALDSMFGPLPALDSLIPKEGATGIQAVLSKVDQAMLGTAPEAATQGSASSQVAPANSKSLFDRVHSVHEVAIKRGSVALYHKRI